MFFSKDLNEVEDILKDKNSEDIWIPYNAGRRTGVGRETLSDRAGDFFLQPPPNSINLREWIGRQLGTGGFSNAISTYSPSTKNYVTSFGSDVTVGRSTGNASVIVPSTNRLMSVQITGVNADTALDGTFTITVDLGMPTINQSYATLLRPNSFVVYDESNQTVGGPTTSFPFIADNSINTVQKEIIGVSGGVLTLRVSNLQVYNQWSINLSF